MKKKSKITMLLLTLVMLLTLAVPVTASAATNKAKALKAYKTLLSKKKVYFKLGPAFNNGTASYPAAKVKFGLMYLDNDNVPELVIDNTPNIPVFYLPVGYAVFTYKNGKVKQLYYQNTNYKINSYYKKKSVICFPNRTIKNLCFYGKIKGSKLTYIATKDGNKYYRGDSYFYSEKPKPITKSKFNWLLKQQVGSTKATVVKYYKNTAANRKKYLK